MNSNAKAPIKTQLRIPVNICAAPPVFIKASVASPLAAGVTLGTAMPVLSGVMLASSVELDCSDVELDCPDAVVVTSVLLSSSESPLDAE